MGASPPICLPAALVSLGPLVGTSQGSGVPGRLGAGWATPVPCSPQASLRSLQASPRSEHGLKVPHPHGLPPPLSLPPSVHPASSSSSPTSPTRTDPGHRRSRAQPAVAPGVCGLRPPPPLLVRFDSVLRNRCTLPGFLRLGRVHHYWRTQRQLVPTNGQVSVRQAEVPPHFLPCSCLLHVPTSDFRPSIPV